MGTRSTTIVLDGNSEVVRIYRQYDGYPEGHGVELAKICNVTLCNGFGSNADWNTHANGMQDLAATIVAKLKTGIGNVYLEPTGGEINDWVEYVYFVRANGDRPSIEVASFNGEVMDSIGTFTPERFLATYEVKRKAS
jgi:hypothetical protein